MKKILLLILYTLQIHAADYHIGPNQPLSNIADAPWANLQAGDTVYIHWRATAYKEKWVINAQGTENAPISIIGVSNNNGEKPIIDGNNATTVNGLNFWNEARGVIKIGGSNTPSDGLPSYIIIDNLDIRSGRPPYQFTDDNNITQNYANNAASIYVEKAQNLIIRNCIIHDSGNGIFIGANGGDTQNIMIEKNYIYNNGNVGRIFEHNTYTAAIDITYQFNHFGPLRSGALGNNLKDRSAGLKVRYNWIESGNRQLDLVDAEDSQVLVNHPSYNETFVYGNILIEPDAAGNSQIIHYGGDSGTIADYRKGTLYLFNNTIISTRSGNTTLLRLSSMDETAEVFNNIIYNTANGNNMAMIDDTGILNLSNNWLKTDWQDCHCSPTGTVNNISGNITGSQPNFNDFANQDFHLQDTSAAINNGINIPSILLPSHALSYEYIKHQQFQPRLSINQIDIGAYENCGTSDCDLIFKHGFE
ncbi:MAG TPA: polysaccharide-degrading enzyme [Oceanospirillales bacterium]|nr:polysaccharide-degrading enzyme [Oceanospirillales bacterium]